MPKKIKLCPRFLLLRIYPDSLFTRVGSKTTYESNNESQHVTTDHNKSQRVKIALQQVTKSQNCITTSHNESKLHCNKSQGVEIAFQQVTTSQKRVTTSQKRVQRVRIITTSQSYKLTNAE